MFKYEISLIFLCYNNYSKNNTNNLIIETIINNIKIVIITSLKISFV